HIGNARCVAPDSIESLGDGKVYTHRAHEHQSVNDLGMVDSSSECNRGTHRVPHEMGSLDAYCLHKAKQMLRPTRQSIGMLCGQFRIAEPHLVISENVEPLGQRGNGMPPVGPRRNARSRAMN